MRMYLIEGAFSFLHILPIAAVCYTIVFMMIWLIGKRKPSVKLIPSYINSQGNDITLIINFLSQKGK